MPASRICKECGNPIPTGESLCPHCARPALYPNVEAAEQPEERSALEERYCRAVGEAEARGCEAKLREFEQAASTSRAVVARSSPDLFRLATSDREIYATYYQQIRAGVRLIHGDKWDILRAVVDDALFPNYKDHIRFAALSLDGQGLPKYGNCSIVLRDGMIAHRATTFEGNSVIFLSRCNIRMGQAYRLPRGHRSTWGERRKLCAAKKADQLHPSTDWAEFPELLLKERARAEDDDFVEVHIWGPMTRCTFEKVVIRPGANATRAERARLKALKLTLDEAGVPVEEV